MLSLSEDYIIRWFNDDDVEAYIRGLNKALYDEYDKAIFDWKWCKNPNSLGFTTIAVVEHKTDGPVGFNSYLPIEIRRGKEVFKAVQGCDGFVDKSHRRKGLFQKTLIFLEEEAQKLGAEILIGFNLVEAASAAQKAGSEFAYDMNKCFLKPSQIEKTSSPNIYLEPADVNTIHKMYMSWATKTRLFTLNRSKEYLRWKLLQHPFKLVESYVVYEEETRIGYIVTDKVTEGKKTTLTINDYSPVLMDRHLGDIVEILTALNKDITVLEMDTMQGTMHQKVAVETGFEVVPWYQVIMKALKDTEQSRGTVYRGGVELSHIQNWHLAESDIY